MRKRKQPNVKAAAAGAKEVIAELSGDMSAARQFGAKESRVQRNSGTNRGGGSPSRNDTGRKSVYPVVDLETGGPAAPYRVAKLAKFRGVSTREYTTEVYSDKDFNQRPGLITVPVNNYQWLNLQNAASANQENRGIGWLDWITDLYSAMVRGIQSKGINVPLFDTFLATPSNMAAWLQSWSSVYACVYALESMLAAGNYDRATEAINNAIMQNLPTLQALSRRIRQFVVPQGLVDLTVAQHGVKLYSETMAPIWYHSTGSGATSPIDYTVAANIAILLTNAETTFAGMLASVATPDFARIPNTLAKAFPAPTFPVPKVSTDSIEYDQLFNMMMCYNDTTAVTNVAMPNANLPNAAAGPAPALVPLYFREEVGENDPNLRWAISLLKLQVYSVDPIAGQASGALSESQIGLGVNQSSNTVNFTQLGEYDQFGVFTNRQLLGAGATTLSALTMIGESAYWSALAASKPTSSAVDHRIPRGYYSVYASTSWLWDETIRLAEDIFLAPIR